MEMIKESFCHVEDVADEHIAAMHR